MISNFQSMADADGVDFLNADGLFLDRIENQNITGMQAALVVDFTPMNSTMYVQDVAANLVTTEFLNQAGVNSTFYLTGYNSRHKYYLFDSTERYYFPDIPNARSRYALLYRANALI